MALAIFDLDNTLLAGDSDYLWGEFLIEQGRVDAEQYRRQNERFYQDYRNGSLDIMAFLRFALQPLAAHSISELHAWRDQFIDQKIKPIMLPKAAGLIERHRADGDTLMVITATNRFVTEPIVSAYGIDHLLATEPEFKDGRYTGEVAGVPCFQHGKVIRLNAWLAEQQQTLAGSWFYSDSINDVPLLSKVSHPVAVDPDDHLQQHAKTAGWPVISLRNTDLSSG
ncbi:MAG: HAD family hydrolase [Methylococcales bacterium]|nr:HAD family hydrolase [Methylococcales bacterium]